MRLENQKFVPSKFGKVQNFRLGHKTIFKVAIHPNLNIYNLMIVHVDMTSKSG